MIRPFVTLSAAMSIDGFIDDATPERLLISSAADFAAVDALRAESDAILVGGGTIRADNPRLLVRDGGLRDRRLEAGRPEHPVKITLTASGDLDPNARFFAEGTGAKWVFTTPARANPLKTRLGPRAEVLTTGEEHVDLAGLLQILNERSVKKLLVEGGSDLNTQFLRLGLVDRLRLSVGPLFVGQENAPRWVGPGLFPHGANNRLRLVGVETLGDSAVLQYDLG